MEDFTSITNAELEEIDTYLTQEEFYYCQQPKLFDNFYAKEPQDGDVFSPELDDSKVELDEYPLEEQYDDQLHRELLTRGDTETMKKWLEQEAMFTPKLQCETCKVKKCESCNLLNSNISIGEKELYEKLLKNVEVVELNGKKKSEVQI